MTNIGQNKGVKKYRRIFTIDEHFVGLNKMIALPKRI